MVFAWSILKAKEIGLIGLDHGYPADMPREETYYWTGTVDKLGALDASAVYEKFYHPFFKTEYVIDPAFTSYREGFIDALILKPQYTHLTNCSHGTLFHPLLDCMHFEDWLKK